MLSQAVREEDPSLFRHVTAFFRTLTCLKRDDLIPQDLTIDQSLHAPADTSKARIRARYAGAIFYNAIVDELRTFIEEIFQSPQAGAILCNASDLRALIVRPLPFQSPQAGVFSII